MIEVGFIVFLFYSNLLMGEFTATNSPGKSLAFAMNDILTRTNFLIGLFSALIHSCPRQRFSKSAQLISEDMGIFPRR